MTDRFTAGPPQGETAPLGGSEHGERGGLGFTAGPSQGETAPMGGSEHRERGGLTFVLDTNIALDLWVFDEPVVEPLRQALAAGAVWWATPVMRDELARVLAYPHLVARLAASGRRADEVLARWDAAVTLCPVPPKARYTCTDADDQKFIDLAAARALQTAMPLGRGPAVALVSKDKAVLRLTKRLATLGVAVQRVWSPIPLCKESLS